MFDKNLADRFLEHIRDKTLEELDEKASKAPCSGMCKIYDEVSEMTQEQIEWLLSRKLSDNPKMLAAIQHYRETHHGVEFQDFKLFDSVGVKE